MTDLNRLKVSLTKHGAHKLAELIMAFPRNQLLSKTWDKYKEIRIDLSQAKNILSVDDRGLVPYIWEQARESGLEAVQELLLLAIIFSHHDLIKAMQAAANGNKKGVVKRGEILAGKAYTNFACILDELEFAVKHSSESVAYDLNRLFVNPDLIPLAGALLKTKLLQANWDQQNDLISECISLGFEKALSVSPDYFSKWLTGHIQISIIDSEIIEDEPEINEFKFRPGHVKRKRVYVYRRRAETEKAASALHNEIQDKLYIYLSSIHGKEAVGTERNSGLGTMIDVVLSIEGQISFFEIKTDETVRKCIREALPQLLEYAYWPNRDIANKLIIVSQNKITSQARSYMRHLRNKFKIPVYYQQMNLEKNILEDLD